MIWIRTGHLPPLGPHDIHTAGITKQFWPVLLDELRAIRGDLIVNAYLH